MYRTILTLVIATAATHALHDDHDKGGPKVKPLSVREIAEKVDDKKTKVTTVEVTLEPGQASAPHRHPGPVFG
jgi:quercetin dioxygenase-like cupin family protein